MEKFFQIFPDRTSFAFDALSTCRRRPPTPVEENTQAFYEWGLDNNYPPIGSPAPIQVSRFKTSEPC